MLRVIILGVSGPVILSALGLFCYGYTHGLFWRVIVWALACTVSFSWFARSSFKHALSTAPPSAIGRPLLAVAIVSVIATAFVADDSLVYLFARLLQK